MTALTSPNFLKEYFSILCLKEFDTSSKFQVIGKAVPSTGSFGFAVLFFQKGSFDFSLKY